MGGAPPRAAIRPHPLPVRGEVGGPGVRLHALHARAIVRGAPVRLRPRLPRLLLGGAGRAGGAARLRPGPCGDGTAAPVAGPACGSDRTRAHGDRADRHAADGGHVPARRRAGGVGGARLSGGPRGRAAPVHRGRRAARQRRPDRRPHRRRAGPGERPGARRLRGRAGRPGRPGGSSRRRPRPGRAVHRAAERRHRRPGRAAPGVDADTRRTLRDAFAGPAPWMAEFY